MENSEEKVLELLGKILENAKEVAQKYAERGW